MSKANEPGPAQDAAISQVGQNDAGEAAKHTETSAYKAPYHPYEKSRVPGEYMVAFRPGYTLAEHFAFPGCKFEVKSHFIISGGYSTALDDQTFDAVRRDPGVEFIEDNTFGKLED